MGLLNGKTALVTGSSRGIGRTIALTFAREGADVVIHDRHEGAASEYGESTHPEDTVKALVASGRRSLFVSGDVSDARAVSRFVAQALTVVDRFDILVNAAGGDIAARGGKPDPNDCLGIPEEDIHAILDSNLLGTMNCCRAVAPAMAARGEGRIVNVASVAGEMAVTNGSIYAVAKAAIIHYTRCLAAELRHAGVNVNCISPGATQTARFMATRAVPLERLSDPGRLTRLGRPEDIANVAVFLCSELADYVHGQTIRVDGGARM